MSAGPSKDVAIIGMACIYPGAPNVERYWENILHKVDAVSDAPPEWEAEFFYDPDSEANDRTYCRRGGFLGKLAEFHPTDFGVMPNAVDGTEPDHFLALRVAYEALRNAGISPERMKQLRERTEVIIGRGTYVNRGNTTAIQHSVVVDSVMRILQQLHPEHTADELAEIRRNLKSSLPPFHADTAPGLVPNIITGRIANRLDLMGPNYLVDAACASSLVAVDLAMRDLLDGRCDMAIAGGTHVSTPATIMVIFSHLKALSKKGQIRPFDQNADGTLLGEGVGMLVLKRLEEAERDGDRIWAVIKGVGTASDGRALGLLAPRREGEELALRRAYEAAGVDPATVELVEAHGTATPVGDAVEVEALNRVFGERSAALPDCALGSVKSMISHTMPASGAAGLIKTALALHHKVLPATLHCETPNPKLDLAKSRLYLNTETRPWIHGTGPRRAGVNAFGFGGINAHTVLEEYTGPNQAPWLQHRWECELFVLSAPARPELLAEAERLLHLAAALPDDVPLKDLAWTVNCARPLESCRMAIVASSRADLAAKLERALGRLKDERTRRIRDIEGIYYFREPVAGKLAFVFPGEGAQYENMLADLCLHFPEVRGMFDMMERAFEGHTRGYRLKDAMFPPPGAGSAKDHLWSMQDLAVEAVFTADLALHALLASLEIRPDAMLGHSTGENAALVVSGVLETADENELIRHILGVNQVFEDLKASGRIPEGVLLTVGGADRAWLESVVAQAGGRAHIALSNCPHQIVLCGTEEGIDFVMRQLAGRPAICQKLPWARAYHTPWFDVFSAPTRRYFESVRIARPRVPLYSCTTAKLYPEDPDEVRTLASIQWARQVRFLETIEQMHRDGFRIFVESGPRGSLTGFIDDILRGKPYLAVPANVPHRSGMLQLHHLLAQLTAHGVPVRLERLYEHRAPQKVTGAPAARRAALPIATGLQGLRLPASFALPKHSTPEPVSTVPAPAQPAIPAAAPPAAEPPAASPVAARDTVLQQHLHTMRQFLEVQQRMMGAYLASRGGVPAPAPQPRPLPFVTEILELSPGSKAVAQHRFSLQRDLLVLDHLLGRNVSSQDSSLTALPVVPMTIFMEALAEAGSLLEPGKVLAGIRDFRLYRWVTLDEGDVTVEFTAERRPDGTVWVTMREAGKSGLRPLWAEGLMLFDGQYPQEPPRGPFPLRDERRSAWKPDLLYYDGMFHGPAFRAVKTVDRVGSDGGTCTLQVLPFDTLIASEPKPNLLLDPLILDAAGQAVSFWIQEHVDPTGDIFPYRLAELRCYAAPGTGHFAPGARLDCRVRVTRLREKDMSSDIDVVDSYGNLFYRLDGWEDRRFPQSPRFRALRREPRESCLSHPWEAPLAAFPGRDRLACCRLDTFSREFLEASHGIWLKVLVHLVLSRRELEQWRSMRAAGKRRYEWLLGRCAAKDAVRLLVKQHFGLELCPADVEIAPDSHGRPEVRGSWIARLGVQPVISVSHSQGTAVALAALDPRQLIGIDLEHLSHGQGFENAAFADEERRLLAAFGQDLQKEWSLRMWCAKEAAAKALGRGMPALHALCITRADPETGMVRLELRDGLLKEFPQFREKGMTAYTAREQEFVYSAIAERPGERP